MTLLKSFSVAVLACSVSMVAFAGSVHCSNGAKALCTSDNQSTPSCVVAITDKSAAGTQASVDPTCSKKDTVPMCVASKHKGGKPKAKCVAKSA